ncbi:MAG: hypothetical protein ACRDNW_10555 [Trebonia sp.]
MPGQRAGGLHARTIEVLDQRGIGDRFNQHLGEVLGVTRLLWSRRRGRRQCLDA